MNVNTDKQCPAKTIDFDVLGVGAWGQSFRNWDDLKALINGQDFEDDGAKGPKPEVIPANERRRAPLPVRLAVESSWQAVQNAGFDPKKLPSVFVSSLGDTQLTDYMCKVLAGDNKALSPTKFHNSVHNAAAGYWTISTGCMQAANSVAGFEQSVALTLFEALIQAQSEATPILLTFYDAPSSAVLKELLKNEQSFAVSLVIAPTELGHSGIPLSMSVDQRGVVWPDANWGDALQHSYDNNPVAKILPLLKLLIDQDGGSTSLPLSEATSVTLQRS